MSPAPRVHTDELANAQQALGRAIGRARAGEDRELAQKVREGGETVAHLLGGLLKMSRVHAADNRAFDAPIQQLVRALSSLVDLLGPVHLVAVEDQVYVNDVRIRSEGKGSAKDLSTELAKHNVGGLRFHEALDSKSIRILIDGFASRPADTAPRHELHQSLIAQGLQSVDLAPRYRFRTHASEVSEEVHDPTQAVGRTITLVQETFDNLAAGRVLNPLPLRRCVVEILEVGPENPALWSSLWDASFAGAPHAVHSVWAAIVALLLGKAIKLRPSTLQDLGVAALIHDIGYTRVPDGTPTTDSLTSHPAEGARIMLRQRGFHEAKLRRLRAVLDHHRDYTDPRAEPSVLGQLLRLAEDYTSWIRVNAAEASPADVVAAIQGMGAAFYHPALTQLMANVLGQYPPGTMVELADGRRARSVSPVRGPETFATPIVRIYEPDGVLGSELEDVASGLVIRRAMAG